MDSIVRKFFPDEDWKFFDGGKLAVSQSSNFVKRNRILKMEWIKGKGKPEDNKMVVAICKASPIPFICIYQNGEPTQVISSFSKTTVTHKFKTVVHEIIAFQYLESGDILTGSN